MDIGALDRSQEIVGNDIPHSVKVPAGTRFGLTPLGRHLTCLPCDPALGKLLIYGCLLRCLDPVLTIAAALTNNRPIFMSPPACRGEVCCLSGLLAFVGVHNVSVGWGEESRPWPQNSVLTYRIVLFGGEKFSLQLNFCAAGGGGASQTDINRGGITV